MKITKLLAAASAIATAAIATTASAQSMNQPAPANPIWQLAGQALPHAYTSYSFSFVAGTALTNLTFAFRDDPAYFSFDNVVMTGGSSASNLLTNGNFEAGVVGASAPTGWTYVNQYGANAAGRVATSCGVGGSTCYYDGAVGAYDAITQAIATTVGQTYNVSFMLTENSSQSTASALATSTLAGINVAAYAQAGVPAAGNVPEPASWAMMILGMGAVGYAARRRQKVRVAYAA